MAENSSDVPPPKLPVEKSFLEEVINKHYGTNAILLDVQCDIGEGKGFMSIMTRVRLTFDKPEGLPSAVVIKQVNDVKIKQVPQVKEVLDKNPGMLASLHKTELNAYTFFTEDGPSPFPIPTFIYGHNVTDSQEGILILEYVEGASLTFNEDNMIEEIETLIKHIASVQAYAINKGERMHEFFDTSAKKNFEDFLKDGMSVYAKLQAADPKRFWYPAEQVKELSDQVNEDFKASINGKLPYTVLSLGDTQPNNILWKLDKDGKRTSEIAAFVDFQACYPGKCTHDVANLIFWGLLPEARAKHQDRLVELFHKDLSSKTGGKVPISLSQAKEELRREFIGFAIMFLQILGNIQGFQKMIGMTDERLDQLKAKVTCVFDEHIQK